MTNLDFVKTTRYHYLDHLRAFAMLFGILVHATTLADFGYLEIFSTVSDNFRMGTFFVLSGFFAGMLLDKRSKDYFLKTRLMAIGIPFVVTLILLNPISIWLVYNVHNQDIALSRIVDIISISIFGSKDVSGPIVWHLHLWFLISLFVYTVFAPAVNRIIELLLSKKVLNNIPQIYASYLGMTIFAFSIALFVMAMRLISNILLQGLDSLWVVRATLTYFPWYAVGLFCWHQKNLWERMHFVDPILWCIVILLWSTTINADVSVPLYVFRRSITIFTALCLLLFIFRKLLDVPNQLASKITDGSYSIYLFHYFFIYLFGTMCLYLYRDGSSWLYWTVVISTFIATYAIHRKVISRITFMSFLLNGKVASSR